MHFASFPAACRVSVCCQSRLLTAARAQQWSAKPWKTLCASLEHFQFLVCYTSSTLEKSLCFLPPTVLGHETSMAVFQRFGGCFSFLWIHCSFILLQRLSCLSFSMYLAVQGLIKTFCFKTSFMQPASFWGAIQELWSCVAISPKMLL